VFTGALALIALETVLRTNASTGRVAGLLTGAAKVVEKVLDPTVPAIPDLR
jgi:hypothetical protein